MKVLAFSSSCLLAFSLGGCVKQQTQMGQTEGRTPVENLSADVTSAPHGMVATNAPLSAEAGAQVLREGGNAVDALVAAAFVHAVVYPEAGNIGGGGFIVAHFADGKNVTLDAREVAPLKATRDMYVDANGNVTKESLTGYKASGVPGVVAGLYEFHKKYGTKPWRDLLQPAIKLARDGFIVSKPFHDAIAADHRLKDFPASAAMYLHDGAAPEIGSTWKNEDFAKTLERIADRGRDGFYKGETADMIVAEMQRGGGLISHEDLERYQPKWRDPIVFTYRNHKVISMAPASSGGITLALMANILNGYDLRSMGAHSAERYHLIAEASRRAFADRNALLGDPDFVKVPQAELLSPDYAAKLRASISMDHATPSTQIRPSLAESTEGHETTHLSFVDSKGNAVAFTTTLNELFGSAVGVSGAGFVLNDEMDDFTSKVGAANMFGLVQGAANAIEPGKRMLSAMTPTIVLDNKGKVLLVTGARGGPRIISAVFQIISNVLDHGMGLPEAVMEPRIHMQHLPDSLYHEKNAFDAATAAKLEAMGHHLTRREAAIGSATAILRVGNQWIGMSDPRSTGGIARGY